MEFLANIIDALKYADPGWAMLVGSLGSLYFTAKIYREKSEANRSGIAIKNVNKDGVAILVNDSRVDYKIKAERFILENGANEQQAKNFLMDFFSAKNKRNFILKIAKEENKEEILPEQVLGCGESMNMHIYDMPVENIYAMLVLVRLFFDGKERNYIYSFANQEKVKNSDILPEDIKNKLHPYNNWVKVYSFE